VAESNSSAVRGESRSGDLSSSCRKLEPAKTSRESIEPPEILSKALVNLSMELFHQNSYLESATSSGDLHVLQVSFELLAAASKKKCRDMPL
jgi:hypothetical protein